MLESDLQPLLQTFTAFKNIYQASPDQLKLVMRPETSAGIHSERLLLLFDVNPKWNGSK
jgi:hypothetical protein